MELGEVSTSVFDFEWEFTEQHRVHIHTDAPDVYRRSVFLMGEDLRGSITRFPLEQRLKSTRMTHKQNTLTRVSHTAL